ncbi:MAG: GHKL domain-containing protein [Lachnospiraceae bacterium]|nr:GHKL domain-containing protein [Lachnospiraceae bacterium]
MPFGFRLTVVVILMAVEAYTVFRITVALLGERPRWRCYLLFYVVYNALEWGLILVLELFEGNTWTEPPLWIHELEYILTVFFLCMTIRRGYHVSFDKVFGAVAVGFFAKDIIYDFLTDAAVFYSPVFDGKYLYVITSIVLPYSLLLVFSLVTSFVLNKTEFSKYFLCLFRGRVRTGVTLSACLLLLTVNALRQVLFPNVAISFAYGLFCFSVVIAALFCIQFSAMYVASRDKVKAQEETIAQQQAHMELLEELQGEIRAFRHDFTNLLSGMALSAQEGDVEAIQEFMRRTSGYFDEKLGSEIRQMEGLSNIQLYPVRSLISTKLSLMRQRHIQVTLEIMKPVTGGRMPVEDLLRCQGILLDNAIEAAAKNDGKIRVILLQDMEELFIAVANNYDEKPNLGALAKSGYSTKGKGRGTGLSSYRRMVSRCADCVSRTYLKDEFLVQELRIPV